MAVDFMARAGEWNEWDGIWFMILPDPLTGAAQYRVTVHADPLHIQATQPCGGFRIQNYPPDTLDFASTDGEPL